MPVILANNNQFFYQQLGHGSDVILIAGFSANHHIWDRIAHALAKHHRVTYFDNRGAGQSSTPTGPYSTEQMANDTQAIMSALSIKKAVVIGHSMGGHIGQHLAINDPQIIQHLILVSSKAYSTTLTQQRLEVMQAIRKSDLAEDLKIRNLLLWLFSNRFLAEKQAIDNFIEFILENPFPISDQAYDAQAVATLNHDTRETLQCISVPTTIIHGSDDLFTPASQAEILHANIKNSKLIWLEGVGHVPQIEAHHALLDAINTVTTNISM